MLMKRITALLLAAILLLSLAACGAKDPWQEKYDLGMRCLNEGNYQEAVIAFEAAIGIDAKRPEAYLGAAEAYIAADDIDAAIAILEKGLAATGDQKIKDKLDELDGNLTGQPPFTLQDMADMGYSYGMDVYDLIASGVIADDEETRQTIEWIQENPDQWSYVDGTFRSLSGTFLAENPHIAINYSSKMELSGVWLFDGDTCAGPHGVRLDMTTEEVLRLFRCENPAALEFAKTKDKALLENDSYLPLYYVRIDDRIYQASLILDEDGELRISYFVSDMRSDWEFLDMTVYIKDDSVDKVYTSYYYYD